jgi:hypothetical protein
MIPIENSPFGKKDRFLVNLTSALFNRPFLPACPFLPTHTFRYHVKVFPNIQVHSTLHDIKIN